MARLTVFGLMEEIWEAQLSRVAGHRLESRFSPSPCHPDLLARISLGCPNKWHLGRPK